MTGNTVLMLVTVTAALFLATRALRSHGLSFERKVGMAVAWVVIIAALALVIGGLGS